LRTKAYNGASELPAGLGGNIACIPELPQRGTSDGDVPGRVWVGNEPGAFVKLTCTCVLRKDPQGDVVKAQLLKFVKRTKPQFATNALTENLREQVDSPQLAGVRGFVGVATLVKGNPAEDAAAGIRNANIRMAI